MKRILFFLMFLPILSFAQVNEDFSDSNFTITPVWTGDDSLFVVSAGELRSNSAGANTYYLSTPSTQATEAQWEFYINLKFPTSGANYVDVYLMSDVSALTTPNDGYFVRLGGTPDEISLYKIISGAETMIIDGPDGIINSGSNNPFQIRVSRDASDNWELEYDDAVTGNFQSAGTVIDNSISTSSFFGFAIVQSGAAGPVNNHYFDNITVGPIPVDSFPPTISSVSVTSDTTLDVFFSEFVELNSSQIAGNYSADNGIGIPNAAMRDGVDSTMVHLTFSIQFGNGITNILTVTGVADILANSIVTPETATFLFYVPDTADQYDVVINELLPDPSPVVGLPDAEFIELYNNSNKIIDLASFSISDGGTPATIPAKVFLPGTYVILCNAGDTALYAAYGDVLGVSIPGLNNTGDNIELRDSNGKLIHSVNYLDSWYADGTKDDGGWSLEMIDPSNPCAQETNWRASVNPNGGTPGQENSVFSNNPDNTAPMLLRADVVDSLNVLLTFNEALDDSGVSVATYTLSNNLVLVTASQTTTKTITLTLSTSLAQGVVYTVSITDLKDCVGNIIGNPNSANFAMPEQGQPGDLIINEILFNPRANYFNDGSDFVEIYNNSQRFIDLNGWQLANTGNDTIDNIKSITTASYIVFPGDYVVLSKDIANIKAEYPEAVEQAFLQMESLPGYNNGDGTVVLINNLFQVSDSITYNEDMQFVLLNDVNGVSLERLDFDRPTHDLTNWHSASEAVGFATPGYLNSQYNPANTSEGEVTIDPELFSPDNDGVKDVVNISYKFDAAGFVGTITIYDAKGRLIKSLIQNELLGTSGTYSWDGITGQNERARIGIYIIYFEVFGLGGEIRQFKKTCVLAAKL